MKNKICKLKGYLKEPKKFILNAASKGCFNWMSDDKYLQFMYRVNFNKKLDLSTPKTFNEKLQWLKLYDRRPEYTMMVDKYKVRRYIADTIGEEYLIPLLGVWDKPEDIEFDKLPEQFVLKCNHNSGTGMCICKDKSKLDIDKVIKGLRKGLAQDYFKENREWPYKNVKRKIIAEKYMEDESGELRDYKLMCFNGKFACSFVCSERYSDDGLKVTFFDDNWNAMPFERHYPKSTVPIKKPKLYNEMISLAEMLSKDIPFARIDFYEVKGKLYFGEITLYPGSGFEEFSPEAWDYKLGDLITLPDKRC